METRCCSESVVDFHWTTQKLLGSLSKSYCHLGQFIVNTIVGPTNIETKFHFTRHSREHFHRQHSDSHCNPLVQTRKRLHPFSVHDVFDVPLEEEVHGY
jgi:hypothetical protein